MVPPSEDNLAFFADGETKVVRLIVHAVYSPKVVSSKGARTRVTKPMPIRFEEAVTLPESCGFGLRS